MAPPARAIFNSQYESKHGTAAVRTAAFLAARNCRVKYKCGGSEGKLGKVWLATCGNKTTQLLICSKENDVGLNDDVGSVGRW